MMSEFKKISSNIYRCSDDAAKFRFYITIDGVRYSKTFYAVPGTKTNMKEEAAAAFSKFKDEKSVSNNWFNKLSEAQKNITFDEYFRKWVKIKRKSLKNGSKLIEGVYKNHIKDVLGDLKVSEITPVDISELMDNLHSKRSSTPLSKSAKKAILDIVKGMYKKLVDEEVVLRSPIKAIHEVKRSYREEKTLVTSPVETFMLVKTAIYDLYGDRPKLLSAFLFGLLCGKRVNEVLTLKWSDINFEENKFIVRAKNNKVHEDMEYSISDELILALRGIRRGRDKFIFTSKNTKTGRINSLQHHYKKIRSKSGVVNYTFHYQRNIYVSALSAKGVPDHELASNLGHVDTQQIKTYLTKDRVNISKRSGVVIENMADT